jgi:hypothetical protein
MSERQARIDLLGQDPDVLREVERLDWKHIGAEGSQQVDTQAASEQSCLPSE